MTLQDRIAELASLHGSLRKAAEALGTNAGYLSRLARGENKHPGPALLRRLGLKQVITYEKIVTDR